MDIKNLWGNVGSIGLLDVLALRVRTLACLQDHALANVQDHFKNYILRLFDIQKNNTFSMIQSLFNAKQLETTHSSEYQTNVKEIYIKFSLNYREKKSLLRSTFIKSVFDRFTQKQILSFSFSFTNTLEYVFIFYFKQICL